MSDDVIERMIDACFKAGQTKYGNPLGSHAGMSAAAGVLLDWLGTFHGIPASELLQARRELGLTSMAAAEPATEPGEGVGRVVDRRV